MTFSEFAKMLYPLIGKEQRTSDFIIELTNQIMIEPDTEHDKQLHSENKYNPLSNYDTSMLGKIYNGSRELSAKVARVIIAHLDKKKFIEYVERFPEATTTLLHSALQKSGFNLSNTYDTINVCADLFESILCNCANKVKNSQKEKTKKRFDMRDAKNISPDAIAQWERMEYLRERRSLLHSIKISNNRIHALHGFYCHK